MDGSKVIEDLLGKGFVPEDGKEENFIDNLKERGFVFFDKAQNKFKMKEGVNFSENYDEIILEKLPVVKSVGLYSENNNFSPRLEVKIKLPNVFLKVCSTEAEIRRFLGKHSLGELVDATAIGYGSTSNNEAFLVEVDHELCEDLGLKYTKMIMTTAISRGGNARDSKNLDFGGVRPTKLKMKIGAQTSFGVVFSYADLLNMGEKYVIDKARFFC